MSSKPQLTEIVQIAKEEEQKTKPGVRGLLAELRKRKVCRTAISYMLIMWLNLQIGDVMFPMLGLPDWSLSLIIIIGIMGFPVVVILAWAFQVTPEGIVLDENAEPETRTDRQLDSVVNLLLLFTSVILSGLLLLQFHTGERLSLPGLTTTEAPRGAVVSNLSFKSATEEADSQAMAAGIHDEVRHRLINLEGVELLPDVATINTQDDQRYLALSGSLLLEGKTAHVIAHLIDLSAGRYIMSVTFNMELETTLALETAAAARIVDEVSRSLVGDHQHPDGRPETT